MTKNKQITTHTVTLERRTGGFNGTYVTETVKCRLLTRHIVLENGKKYKLDDGLMVGGRMFKGQYMESTQIKPISLKEIK